MSNIPAWPEFEFEKEYLDGRRVKCTYCKEYFWIPYNMDTKDATHCPYCGVTKNIYDANAVKIELQGDCMA